MTGPRDEVGDDDFSHGCSENEHATWHNNNNNNNNNNSEAKASVPGTSNRLGERVIEYAILLCELAQQWRPRQKRYLAQR